ncbi:hypothetical protein PanWU01x14_370210 [Parasponia andersonii]|uniref:Uncharacterized protein n=1 Tax=Parasponia andersonii TaxID=3476 RepID=A0A2P5A4C4_PARAD|nr:hypothetical protein PanWU01x14_370210 [Parasponia andersonii]
MAVETLLQMTSDDFPLGDWLKAPNAHNSVHQARRTVPSMPKGQGSAFTIASHLKFKTGWESVGPLHNVNHLPMYASQKVIFNGLSTTPT